MRERVGNRVRIELAVMVGLVNPHTWIVMITMRAQV